MSTADTIAAEDRNALATLQEAMENAVDYIGSASATAGASMKSAAGKTGRVMGAGAYKGAYGVSYGVVFAGVFMKELLPAGNALRRGMEDGAQAAFDAIEDRKAPVAEVEPAVEARPARKSRRAAPAVEG